MKKPRASNRERQLEEAIDQLIESQRRLEEQLRAERFEKQTLHSTIETLKAEIERLKSQLKP
ncbi:MAG: hypothetical protein MOB07_31170 [Acidobacteria bacterium]|nr:hypothetical protein [Acidobacteriota bacterium]